jgi:hypothetical protein
MFEEMDFKPGIGCCNLSLVLRPRRGDTTYHPLQYSLKTDGLEIYRSVGDQTLLVIYNFEVYDNCVITPY